MFSLTLNIKVKNYNVCVNKIFILNLFAKPSIVKNDVMQYARRHKKVLQNFIETFLVNVDKISFQ